jgi:hypothetical protein
VQILDVAHIFYHFYRIEPFLAQVFVRGRQFVQVAFYQDLDF